MRTVSRKGIVLLLGSLAVAVVVVVLLVVQSKDRPGNGVSQSQAITVAWQHTGSGAVAVTRAEVKHNFQTGFDLPTHRWAWIVTFSGQWHLLCSGHVSDTSCDPTSQWVAVDYYTGKWIASQFSFPAGG